MFRQLQIFLPLVLLGACASGKPRAQVTEKTPQSSEAQAVVSWTAEQAIDAAAAYLIRHLAPSGRFDYLRQSRAKDSDYNVLRHAGAIYSLLQYDARAPSPQTKAAIVRAGRYLRSRYIRPIKTRPELLAVFSRPDEESVKGPTAKLGGAGLALIALCGIHRFAPQEAPLAELQALARFILFMQKEDGSFHSKFTEASGYDPNFHSRYYPGEAMLALAHLYQIDPNPAWVRSGLASAAQLVASRKDETRPPADHWMMLAGSPLLQLYDALESPPISSQALLEHLSFLGTMVMRDQKRRDRKAAPSERGGFSGGARSTPTATRLEGLGSLLHMQRNAKQVDPALAASITHGLAFLRRCQIKSEGAEQGGMPRSCAHDAGAERRDAEIRIDYVQHYLSAMISGDTLGLL